LYGWPLPWGGQHPAVFPVPVHRAIAPLIENRGRLSPCLKRAFPAMLMQSPWSISTSERRSAKFVAAKAAIPGETL
jgi:hypothetical protein